MELIEFEQQTVIIAKDQPQYRAMPAHQAGDHSGTTIFCWKLTDEEKQRVMETGVIWHSVMTFNTPLQPQLLSVESPFAEMDSEPSAQEPTEFSKRYAYETLEVYQEYVGHVMNDAFCTGWRMARVTNGQLGITEDDGSESES